MAPFFALLVVGLSAILAPHERYADITRAIGGFIVIWAILVGTVVWKNRRDGYRIVLNAYAAGQFHTVEGSVAQFIPMPYSGHRPESFVLNGHKFEYSDFDDELGFHNASSHGGPIRNGLCLRISYIGKHIVKLEIIRPDAAECKVSRQS